MGRAFRACRFHVASCWRIDRDQAPPSASGDNGVQMRSPAFLRPMSRLALLAALLLLLVPTAGRLLASSEQGAVWAQMCTMAGLEMVRIPLGDADAATQPSPSDDGMPMDCEYCPLLGALTALLLWVMLVLPVPATVLAMGAGPPPRLGRGHPCGLGSRGPPIAL